jgi:chromosome segregation ATPase
MKATIREAIGANGGSDEIDLLERRIDALNTRMLRMVNESVESGSDLEESEEEFKQISEQIEQLRKRIETIQNASNDEDSEARLRLIQTTIDQRNARRQEYDDSIVRQMIECIKVYEGGQIRVIFGGGHEIEESI